MENNENNNKQEFFESLAQRLELDDNKKQQIYSAWEEFYKSNCQHDLKQSEESQKSYQLLLKNTWQKHYDQNSLYAKRGLDWLGLQGVSLNLDGENYLEFMQKMLELGILISEEAPLKGEEEDFVGDKNQATRLRKDLTTKADFMEVMENKNHPKRVEYLKLLNSYNQVIASSS
jgi:hypothetical protein